PSRPVLRAHRPPPTLGAPEGGPLAVDTPVTPPGRTAPPPNPDVSIVVPVYNAGRYLQDCLASLLAQDLPTDRFEVIAVDDGSTDGSGELLDELATRHGNLGVIHQENSGWAGRPRNVGMDLARGRYIFFADADDQMAPDAARALVTFADTHRSDV